MGRSREREWKASVNVDGKMNKRHEERERNERVHIEG